ncbi:MULTISPECIES: hypothetical protein [Enterobacter]|uniref:hypothetical protein n=1 Tax=Enterobacter TaxID=547 RepID=UPI0013787055|nr:MULTISPECIES: hypothetical protein [Enterobacter cloacae complex]MEC5764985.1 hypothetical protein [Enterobacter chengduensis]NBC78622.1 hypothetical protein [Enterobacter asburiae]HBM9902403.1 hypothetical protein [Enterobacter chengduensis]
MVNIFLYESWWQSRWLFLQPEITLCSHIGAADAAYYCFVKGQMKNEVLISVTVDNALHDVFAVNFLRPARVSDVQRL